MRLLVARFVEAVPSPRHRLALETSAHARVTTEPLLADVVGGEDAHELFASLRGLSFMEHGPEGLFPHDLAREVLEVDFRWRDPQGYEAMHRRVWLHLKRRVRETSGRAQQRVFFDKLYLHRNHPVGGLYHHYASLGNAYADLGEARDHAAVIDIVRSFEGDESAAIAAHWLRRQPMALRVHRHASGEVEGLVLRLAADDMTPEDLALDPAARAATELIRERAPLMQYIAFDAADEVAFTVGGRRYGVYAHDWRVMSHDVWWDLESKRSLGLEAEPLVEPPAAPPLVVLSEPDFAGAVRQALRDYTRPRALADSPLLRSRLVREAAREPSAAALQALLRRAADALRASPRDEKFYRAILHTFLEPAPSQEKAAERLRLSFSTYRYHLARGTERIVEWLWERELGETSG